MPNSLSTSRKSQTGKKVLIIGCGDLGARLATHLDLEGYQVTGIRRRPMPNTPQLRYLSCDVNDGPAFEQIIAEGFNIIVITMTPAERSDYGYQQAYVRTSENLVRALAALNQSPELILFVSSTAVYAQDDGSRVDESAPTAPESFSGKRLLEAENVIRASGFANVILRFSGIYGPGRHRLIEQVRQHKASASRGYTNRIHVEDGAGFIAHLIQRGASAPIYIVTDSAPTPMVEVIDWIADQLGVIHAYSTEAVNERGNKRLDNALMLGTCFRLRYPDFRRGYAELLGTMK
jgi:nucleoside-diphosphate-sugar epimerase